MDVATRQKTYEVRRDRAEVMVIAAIVLCTLGAWLNVDQLLTPGVGVREGLLAEMVRTRFGAETVPSDRAAQA